MAQTASYQVLLVYVDPTSTVDITADVQEFSSSRKFSTHQNPMEVGQAQLKIANVYGRYSPDNAATDLSLTTGLKVYVTGVASGVSATRIWTGTVDSYEVDPSLGSPPTSIFKMSDVAKPLADKQVFTTLMGGTCVTSAFSEIFSAAGLTTSQYSVAAITDVRTFIAFGNQQGNQIDKGLDAVDLLMKSGPWTGVVGRDGAIGVQDRYYANSQTSVNTYTDVWSLNYSKNDDGIINRFIGTTYKIREAGGAPTTNLNDFNAPDDSIPVPASGFAAFRLDYFNVSVNQPIMGDQTSAGGLQITFNSSASGAGTVVTASCSATCIPLGTSLVVSAFNGTGNQVWVTFCNMKGSTVSQQDKQTGQFEAVASQSLYGIRTLNVDSRCFCGLTAVRSCASYVLSLYSTPVAQVSVGLRNDYPFVFSNDVGKAISLVNSFTGINNRFTIMSSDERVTASDQGWIHEAVYNLRPANQV